MSRLSIVTQNKAQTTVENLYKKLECRIAASPPGLCPVDLAISFLQVCHAQTCGKCAPCRIGLGQLQNLLEQVLDGEGDLGILDLIEDTARNIYLTADCAIGYEAAEMVLEGLEGFREDYEEHILRGKCTSSLNQPVPCSALCPAGVDVPGYIALIGEGRYRDAVYLIRKDNPMVTTCALICEHPCETRCRRSMIDNPINIRGLKRYAVEMAPEVPAPKPMDDTGKEIAIIGGGPGGISAAYYLRQMGHQVTIYEKMKDLGGMLRYGIPNYRLSKDLLDREINTLVEGVTIHREVNVGEDCTIEELRKKYDAVYIAIGAQTDRKIGMEGEDAREGIISAVELLRGIGDGERPDFSGEKLVVIGGGNVAMDVARSAIRLGADDVKIVYRRRISDMSATEEEITGAMAEGCEVMELMAPLRVEQDSSGRAVALWVQPQIIGEIHGMKPDINEARSEPQRIPCDKIVVAIGQGIETKPFEESGIPIRRGAIKARNWSGIEDLPGVFAGGDCVTGPATVIRAIAAGKVAAANIDEYLGYHHEIILDVDIPKIRLNDRKPCGRVNMRERDSKGRKDDFDLIELPITHEEAQQEASRCLRCDHFGFGVFKGGRNIKW